MHHQQFLNYLITESILTATEVEDFLLCYQETDNGFLSLLFNMYPLKQTKFNRILDEYYQMTLDRKSVV